MIYIIICLSSIIKVHLAWLIVFIVEGFSSELDDNKLNPFLDNSTQGKLFKYLNHLSFILTMLNLVNY
jgi:hypothetical protein